MSSSTRCATSSSITTGLRSGRSSSAADRATASRSAGSTSTGGRFSATGLRRRLLRSIGPMERWATFDCYGTLIDWDGGVRTELTRVFGDDHADELLARYHEIEPELQHDGARSYRDVLTESMRRLGAPAGGGGGPPGSLPPWGAVSPGRGGLPGVRGRGGRVAVPLYPPARLSPAAPAAISAALP